MRRRTLIMFVVLNVLISLAVVLAVVNFLSPGAQPAGTSQVVITVPILVTATTDLNATPRVVVVTATPLPGQVIVPPSVLDNSGTTVAQAPTQEGIGGAQPLNIGDANASEPGAASTVLPENCIPHALVEGDTPFGVAVQYGADPFRLMEVNGLNDETATFLQIGDVLIVPLEGCPLTAATPAAPTSEVPEDTTPTVESAEGTAEATSDTTAAPTVRPTITLPPTAASAQVEIAEVQAAGDITAEGVVIRNNGSNVNLLDWTLSDGQGNTYTFTERILFSRGLVTIYSRVGQDTAIALFWNRNQAAFEAGDTVTLRDARGTVQGSFRVPETQDLP